MKQEYTIDSVLAAIEEVIKNESKEELIDSELTERRSSTLKEVKPKDITTSFDCFYCGMSYSKEYHLTVHQKTLCEKNPHSSVSKKAMRDFKCATCANIYKGKRNQQNHQLYDCGHEHECTYCNKTFKNVFDYKRHWKKDCITSFEACDWAHYVNSL